MLKLLKTATDTMYYISHYPNSVHINSEMLHVYSLQQFL